MSEQNRSELTRTTDSELGELYSSLSIIVDWLRRKMRGHLVPNNVDELLVKSEQDIGEMIEVYFGILFHRLIQLSDQPTEPVNTSGVNQDENRKRMARLKKKFGLTDESFDISPIGSHLQRLEKLFSSALKGSHAGGPKSLEKHIWAGGHLWLERRLATGFRLLFLEGEQWNSDKASWYISRVVYDWPHTYTRIILRDFRAGSQSDVFGDDQQITEVCTAICAFNNALEKEQFEASSGLRDGQYVYLWTGHDHSDFDDADLVWFKDPGNMQEDESLEKYLPQEPIKALGPEREVRSCWSILRDEWREGQVSGNENLDHTLMMRFVYERKLLRDIYRELEEKDKLGSLPDEHWLRRNTSLLRQILKKEDHSIMDTFWAIQSVMFYDWKYWYIFPFNYEGLPSGGFALSSATPLTERQIKLFANIINELLNVFAETEEWARNRLRQKKEITFRRAAGRVHAEWVRRAKESLEIVNHKLLFQNLSKIALDLQFAYRLKFFHKYDPLNPDFKFLYETWEEQIGKIDYSVVNYWSAINSERVFAEWLSPSLGPEATARWDKVWSIYKTITDEARNKFGYYTFNDFLFDKAPRKAILEWRGNSWQIVPRGQENPREWVTEPPSITPDVALILFKGLKFESEGESNDVEQYIKEIQSRVEQLKEYLAEHANSYSKKLTDFIERNSWTELGLFRGDLKSLSDVLEQINNDVTKLAFESDDNGASMGHISQKRLAAEYLLRLSIYLNVQMNTMEDGFNEEIFLNLYRCAFLSWALYENYHPARFRSHVIDTDREVQRSTDWYFYSIPIHIPLTERDGASRTSIFSLGTTKPLTGDDLEHFGEIGKEIVLPAMMVDLSWSVKRSEQFIAEQQKKHEIEVVQREMARHQVPAALHSARRLVGRTTEKIRDFKHWIENEAEFDSFDAEELRGEVVDAVESVQKHARETEGRISLLNSIAKHFHESRTNDNQGVPLRFPVYSNSGDTSIRDILLRSISLPLNLDESQLTSQNGDRDVADYLKQATKFKWSVDLSGVRNLYAQCQLGGEKRMADQIDCWRILFEEWADNIKGNWVQSGKSPFVNLTLTSNRAGDIVCDVSNGPIPPDLDRTSGIGTMEIEWCVYGLSSFDFQGDDPNYYQGLVRDHITNETIWKMRVIVPYSAIEEGRC